MIFAFLVCFRGDVQYLVKSKVETYHKTDFMG